ncbi:HAMP domain-containing histidine kinase [Myroides marinus]|uniref:sensor histidine kinase n=1 Tax=Myroides marinus TaxID=703342 RepID=UPI002576A627|nr:HAMP domain-containing sensor histidine kinase [Myroides marinus]MDM1367722.1 HAMP domain-containing histidine kinase [Myroides marinus]MDM1371992.1 HAMP domain-containing histidine kinase [Myroides marinus]MDM1375932.1 HAMP domain-containing histidine kinase [Myroides marinus]MDM1382401.1 HAMP domain-containing histidine kinase [Myroides marinus]MDM1389712.1 HAMP domain-containing histidine kinase [Myroides marinus]
MRNKKEIFRWSVITAALITLLVILWNTYSFFQTYKTEERTKMKIWAEALNTLDIATSIEADVSLPFLIMMENKTIPIIQTDVNDSILALNNIDEHVVNTIEKKQALLRKLKSQNPPIILKVGKQTQYVYYGNSSLLTKLKYYPVTLVLIFLFFTVLLFYFYRSNKVATQNKLWTGMAKETAHQIGTPLSSLLGWIEIMRLDNISPDITEEIEKDVKKLQIIADRFSKIGSIPKLTAVDIIAETRKTFDYFSIRNSKQVLFTMDSPDYEIMIPLNKELHSWTIENLIKNAIDAMKGKGKLDIHIQDTPKAVNIFITDSGSGIPKKVLKKIFEPGYTTKKRGWGLGLSLTKRIVEDFQNGKIKVTQSEVGKGTTFCITYNKKRLH